MRSRGPRIGRDQFISGCGGLVWSAFNDESLFDM